MSKATGKWFDLEMPPMARVTVLIEGITPLIVERDNGSFCRNRPMTRAVSEWNKRWHREYMQRQKKATR